MSPGGGHRGELLFLAPGDATKGRVEPISWMRTCEAFAAARMRVTLRTLRVRRPDAVQLSELFDHYGVSETFTLATVPTTLDRDSPTWAFRAWAGTSASTAAVRMAARQLLSSPKPSVAYARAPVLLAPFAGLMRTLPDSRRPRLVFETHSLPTARNGWIVRGADLVVVNSDKLAAEVMSLFGVEERRVLHAPLPPFNDIRPVPQAEARAALGLPTSDSLACYTGKMTQEHNEFLLQAAAILRKSIPSFRFVLVGGNPAILDWTRLRVSELGIAHAVELTGFVAPSDVSLYQSAADVLVYHMPESSGIFRYTTPAKGYEYQASLRRIVATDFPLFGEVFGSPGERAICAPNRTPAGLAAGIVQAFALPDEGEQMIARSAKFVEGRTWARRVELTLECLGI